MSKEVDFSKAKRNKFAGKKIIIIGDPRSRKAANGNKPAKRSSADIPAITINPDRLGGVPTVGGTRFPVVTLIDRLNAGYTIREVAREFKIPVDDLRSVLDLIRDALEDGWLAKKTRR